MQTEEIVFQTMRFSVNMDETSYDGDVEYDEGGDPLINIKRFTADELEFDLKQLIDNKKTNLSLVGVTSVRLVAKQKAPAINLGDPSPAKMIAKNCNIINPATGIVRVSLTNVETDTIGTYQCYIQVITPTKNYYSKYPFAMTIWDV